jgi:hypothetical protein
LNKLRQEILDHKVDEHFIYKLIEEVRSVRHALDSCAITQHHSVDSHVHSGLNDFLDGIVRESKVLKEEGM